MRVLVPVLVALSIAGCNSKRSSQPRYIVTSTPLGVVSVGHPGICVAIDPADSQGVWWWDPGPSGCSTSINGPTVFRAQRASVSAQQSGSIDARFHLPLHVGFRDIVLRVEDGEIRVVNSGLRAAIDRRADLEIPPAYGRTPR